MPKITMIEAITMAHAWEMTHDPTVVVLGEDVGVNGGVFRATAGLQEKFGKDRVQDTPLAEGMIAGMSVGMAVAGTEAGRRNPVHGVHLSGHRSDRESRWPHAPPDPRAHELSDGDPHAARRRNSRAGASLGKPRGDAGAHPGPARGVPLVAGACVWAVARVDTRSGPGDLPRARAPLSPGAPGGGR